MRKKMYMTSVLMVMLAFTLVSNSFSSNVSEQTTEPSKVTARSDSLLRNRMSRRVTLVTGDVVIVTNYGGGHEDISIIPADPTELGQSFQTFETPDGTYVIPSNVNLDKLDIELFNIDYLINEGYNNEANLPVIVSTMRINDQIIQSIERDIGDFKGKITASFPRLSALAARLPVNTIKDSIQTLLERIDVKKIWLDRRVHVSLSESVPLIGAPELWGAGCDGAGIEIAILDTGIDETHPDLDDLDDYPGTTDPKVIKETDFTDDLTTDDLFGHGTHCAGIAAGTGAASGGMNKGVAPGAFLWNVKVLNQYGWGLWSWVISGIEYAAYGPDGIANTGDEVDIISMSLGGAPTDGTDPVSLAVDAAVEAGVVVVVAAGNDYDYFQVSSPGVARKAITVGASDKSDKLAEFSSKGPTIDYRLKPDVLAPGVSISSCVPYGLFGEYYQSWSGTSMATPHVAGAAALMLEANPTIPLGWSSSKYVKNALISTAFGVGYNVYEQGGGRIYVPSAAYTEILVDPATVSFGLYAEDALDNATLTFHNLNPTSNRILTLSVLVYDMATGTPVDCASLNTTTLNIDPSSSAPVLLTINTAVPKSIYSGRLVADVDTGETIHAIFGFAKLNEVTVAKVDLAGAPAADDYVYIIGDPGLPEWIDKQTDEYGKATFCVSDGNYHIISTGWDKETESMVYTIAENTTITSNTIIYLDERNTSVIDFDANKPDQIMAEKSTHLFYEGDTIWIWFLSLWWYPKSSLAHISPTSINTGFTYSYYPEAHLNPSDPGTIDTPQWHKLLFTLTDVTGDTTFVADYGILVQRTTEYKVGVTPDVAERVQFVHDPIAWGSTTFGWQMNVPQSRVEWLSPEPAWYAGWYSKWDPQWDWDFDEPHRSYTPGAETYLTLGEHPFTSGANVYVKPGYLEIYGSISTDTFENSFANFTREISGSLTIKQDGAEVYCTEIWDYFGERISFSGTPEFTVIIEGGCDLKLSTNTYTELTFIADTTRDSRPPRVTMTPLSSDLNCRVPQGEVFVDVSVSDESPISSVGLEYSLDHGVMWTPASEVITLDDTHRFSLGILSGDTYVSLRTNAADSIGNSISQTTLNALLITPPALGINQLDIYLLNAPANTAYFIFADPAYMTRAEATYDVASGGIIYGQCANTQHYGFNTTKHWLLPSGAINSTTIHSATIAMFGSRFPNVAVKYYEEVANLTPIVFKINGTHLWFENRTGAYLGGLPWSVIRAPNYHEDMFTVMVFEDGDNTFFFVYGFDWKGTWAGGIYFKEVISKNLSNYPKAYYIFHWVDGPGQDGIPQSSEIHQEASG